MLSKSVSLSRVLSLQYYSKTIMAASNNNMVTESNTEDLPLLDQLAFQNYPFDIYAGCATGFLKGCNLSSRSHYNLNELKDIKSNHEIKCMCWGNYDESVIFTGQRDGSIMRYSMANRRAIPLPIKVESDMGTMRNIKSHNDLIISAFSRGIVKCQNINQDLDLDLDLCMEKSQDLDGKSVVDIEAGADLFCMDHNKHFSSLILTGGKDNPLKIWDISAPKDPIFSAKNVKNDWLNLTVPVWVTKAEFSFQSKNVVTGTAKAHIRLYDPSSSQRRPVIDIDSKETSPITALAVKPNSDFQVVAGTGKGTLFLVDLRKKSVLRNFKGVKGGVTDIKFHSQHPFFATSSIDRHVYCFDPDAPKQAKCSSVYVCSQINCLLFSSSWTSGATKGLNVVDNHKNSADNASKSKTESSQDDSDGEEESEGLWDSMSIVKTKRKSSSATSESLTKHKRKKK